MHARVWINPVPAVTNAAIVEFCIDVYLNMHQQRARLHVEDLFFYTTSCDTLYGRLVVGIRRDQW